MLSLETVALFSAACFALASTPGPDMLLIASRSVSQGRTAGFASLAGAQVGTYSHALAAALGLSELFLAVPMAYNAVRFAGAAYLLYLAWKTFRTEGTLLLPTKELSRHSHGQIFRQGLLTNLLNPKMVLFVLALFPQFVRPDAGSVAVQILLLATILNLIGLVVNGMVIVMANKLANRWLRKEHPSKFPQYLLTTVFVGLACRLAMASRH